MSNALLQAQPSDHSALLGYENALRGHAKDMPVFAPPDLDTFNALDVSGIPTVYPENGIWTTEHANLVAGMEIVFVFTSSPQRIAAAGVLDGYARELLYLSDDVTGHDNLVSYLVANGQDIDGLNDLAFKAERYDYRLEVDQRAAIIPLEGQRRPQGAYPVSALGPILGPITKAIVSNVQVSTPLAAQSVLAVAALTAQQYADVQPPYFGAKPIPCSAYFLTEAGSGERKTAANSAALAPIAKWERFLGESYEQDLMTYRRSINVYDKLVSKAEAKAKDVAEARQMIAEIGEEPQKPLSPSIVLNEPTIEGLLKSAETSHGGRAVITDEAGAILGGHSLTSEKKQYTFTTLSKAWDASDIVMSRVGRDTPPVRNKRLSMHLMGQSVVINPLLSDPLAQGQGFLARFLTVSAPPRAGFREMKTRATPSDYHALNDWTDHIYGILSRRPVPLRDGTANELKPDMLRLTDDAFDVWRSFAEEVEKAQRPDGAFCGIKPFASKAAEHVLRIAGIFTVIEKPSGCSEIDAETALRAVDLISFYTHEHLRLVEMCGSDPKLTGAAQLIDWIKANRGRYVYKNDIRQHAPRAVRKGNALDGCLMTLCEHNHIRPIDPRNIDNSIRQNCYEVLA